MKQRSTEDALNFPVRDFISRQGNVLCDVPAAEERTEERKQSLVAITPIPHREPTTLIRRTLGGYTES